MGMKASAHGKVPVLFGKPMKSKRTNNIYWKRAYGALVVEVWLTLDKVYYGRVGCGKTWVYKNLDRLMPRLEVELEATARRLAEDMNMALRLV